MKRAAFVLTEVLKAIRGAPTAVKAATFKVIEVRFCLHPCSHEPRVACRSRSALLLHLKALAVGARSLPRLICGS